MYGSVLVRYHHIGRAAVRSWTGYRHCYRDRYTSEAQRLAVAQQVSAGEVKDFDKSTQKLVDRAKIFPFIPCNTGQGAVSVLDEVLSNVCARTDKPKTSELASIVQQLNVDLCRGINRTPEVDIRGSCPWLYGTRFKDFCHFLAARISLVQTPNDDDVALLAVLVSLCTLLPQDLASVRLSQWVPQEVGKLSAVSFQQLVEKVGVSGQSISVPNWWHFVYKWIQLQKTEMTAGTVLQFLVAMKSSAVMQRKDSMLLMRSIVAEVMPTMEKKVLYFYPHELARLVSLLGDLYVRSEIIDKALVRHLEMWPMKGNNISHIHSLHYVMMVNPKLVNWKTMFIPYFDNLFVSHIEDVRLVIQLLWACPAELLPDRAPFRVGAWISEVAGLFENVDELMRCLSTLSYVKAFEKRDYREVLLALMKAKDPLRILPYFHQLDTILREAGLHIDLGVSIKDSRKLKSFWLFVDDVVTSQAQHLPLSSLCQFFTKLKSLLGVGSQSLFDSIIARVAKRLPMTDWEDVLAVLAEPLQPSDSIASKAVASILYQSLSLFTANQIVVWLHFALQNQMLSSVQLVQCFESLSQARIESELTLKNALRLLDVLVNAESLIGFAVPTHLLKRVETITKFVCSLTSSTATHDELEACRIIESLVSLLARGSKNAQQGQETMFKLPLLFVEKNRSHGWVSAFEAADYSLRTGDADAFIEHIKRATTRLSTEAAEKGTIDVQLVINVLKALYSNMLLNDNMLKNTRQSLGRFLKALLQSVAANPDVMVLMMKLLKNNKIDDRDLLRLFDNVATHLPHDSPLDVLVEVCNWLLFKNDSSTALVSVLVQRCVASPALLLKLPFETFLKLASFTKYSGDVAFSELLSSRFQDRLPQVKTNEDFIKLLDVFISGRFAHNGVEVTFCEHLCQRMYKRRVNSIVMRKAVFYLSQRSICSRRLFDAIRTQLSADLQLMKEPDLVVVGDIAFGMARVGYPCLDFCCSLKELYLSPRQIPVPGLVQFTAALIMLGQIDKELYVQALQQLSAVRQSYLLTVFSYADSLIELGQFDQSLPRLEKFIHKHVYSGKLALKDSPSRQITKYTHVAKKRLVGIFDIASMTGDGRTDFFISNCVTKTGIMINVAVVLDASGSVVPILPQQSSRAVGGQLFLSPQELYIDEGGNPGDVRYHLAVLCMSTFHYLQYDKSASIIGTGPLMLEVLRRSGWIPFVIREDELLSSDSSVFATLRYRLARLLNAAGLMELTPVLSSALQGNMHQGAAFSQREYQDNKTTLAQTDCPVEC